MHSVQLTAMDYGWAVAFCFCVAGSVLASYKRDKHVCGSNGGLAFEGV